MKTQETVSGMYEFGNFVNISSLSSYTNTYKKEGYFGRINYDYAHNTTLHFLIAMMVPRVLQKRPMGEFLVVRSRLEN